MKKKIIKLSVERHFQLIGIVTNLSSYKLSWLINSNIGFKLTQLDDIIVENKNETQNFSSYVFEDVSEVTYNLISNKSDNGILIKKLKNIDFFIQIEPNLSDNQKNNLIEQLKEIDNIISILEIDTQNLSSVDYKIF